MACSDAFFVLLRFIKQLAAFRVFLLFFRAILALVLGLEASSQRGAVGYSNSGGHKGQGNVGRSAATWLGLNQFDSPKLEPFRSEVRDYVAQSVSAVLDGHSSLMLHTFLAGLAAESMGGEPREAYWSKMRRDLILARTPEGSLQPKPWHESHAKGRNADVILGDVWTTASWACVLAADLEAKGVRGLKGLQGAKRK